MWFNAHADWFEKSRLPEIRQKLEELPDDKAAMLPMLGFKNPSTMWIIAFFIGHLGIHSFMLRETFGGIFRLFTLDFFLILWFIDLFTTKNKARKLNTEVLMPYLGIEPNATKENPKKKFIIISLIVVDVALIAYGIVWWLVRP